MKTIGERIVEMRNYKNLETHDQLAKFLGVSTSTISTLERNESHPSYKVITAIRAKMPEISLYWLLYGEGEMLEKGLPKEIFSTQKPDKELFLENDLIVFLKQQIAEKDKVIQHFLGSNPQPTSQTLAR